MTSKLSRRQFLRWAGLTSASLRVALPLHLNEVDGRSINLAEEVNLVPQTVGRTFRLTDVYTQPDSSSSVITQLLPDSVHSILEPIPSSSGMWYRVNDGYIQCNTLQLITPYTQPTIIETVENGFWAEVVAPITTVRKWCAIHAPLVTRLGYGAIVYIVDRLVDDRQQVWYGLAAHPDQSLVGWSAALHYAQWTPQQHNLTHPSIRIDTTRQSLVIYDQSGEQTTAVHNTWIHSSSLKPARKKLIQVSPSAAVNELTLGTPYLMYLDDIPVYGVFWHNNFGPIAGSMAEQRDIGPNISNHEKYIELPTFAAQWVYELLMSQQSISVDIV